MADLPKSARKKTPSPDEIAHLRARLEEAEQTLEAIRTGQVDALLVSGPKGDRIFTLSGADQIYRVIVETMNEAALTVDFDGMILFCNSQFAGLMRLPMEKIRGQPVTRFAAEPQRTVLAQVLKQARTTPVRRRLMLRTDDGSVVYVQLVASPLQTEGAGSICLVVNDLTELETSARSITVLRRQQEALERNEQVLRQVADDLVQSNHDLEQFAYVCSHDLKEPLRMVTAFTGLLRDNYAGRLDDKADEYIRFATEGAARMQVLIDDLLAYSRIGKDKEVAAIDVGAVVTAALENLRQGIGEAGARITCEPLPTVQANALEMSQLFQNLIGNAIKFRDSRRPVEIRVSACRITGKTPGHGAAPGAWWQFTVRDNGIGIEPQYAGQIFVIFQRLHTQDEYPGTGVGLAICKKIVERHGGRIWVESEPGAGSTFCFTLPAADGAMHHA